MDYEKEYQEFRELINRYNKFTIISHIRPDGDTIGSALALYNSLKLEGKIVEICCYDSDLPFKFNFLKGFEKYKQKIDFNDSLVITLDSADLSRVGFNLDGRDIVNIDHHKSNKKFGLLNIVHLEVATSVVLYKILKYGFKIDKSVAEAIYTALITDSQNFTTNMVTEDSFKIASELLRYKIEPSYIASMVFKRDTLAHVRLISKAIDSLRLYNNAKVSIMSITKEDLKSTGAKISDIDGIINFGISLVTVEIAILIGEIDDILKVSIRSKTKDISDMAISFGGGGHKNAAGFEVRDITIEELKNKILDYIKVNICDEEE